MQYMEFIYDSVHAYICDKFVMDRGRLTYIVTSVFIFASRNHSCSQHYGRGFVGLLVWLLLKIPLTSFKNC